MYDAISHNALEIYEIESVCWMNEMDVICTSGVYRRRIGGRSASKMRDQSGIIRQEI